MNRIINTQRINIKWQKQTKHSIIQNDINKKDYNSIKNILEEKQEAWQSIASIRDIIIEK